MPPDRLPSKPKHNPCEHCNCVNLKKEVKDFTALEVLMEEGKEITMARSKKRNDVGKIATFIENDTVEIPTVFLPKLSDLGSFSIHCIMGMVEIERVLCDLDASVSLMSYYLLHKPHLGHYKPHPFHYS